MIPRVVPMLFMPKKDETWMIRIDCHVINNITIKYRHLVSRLDDMLDELHVYCIFTKIN